MAGEFTGSETHDTINTAAQTATQAENPGKVETDVSGVFADGLKDDLPIFNVSDSDFNNNMKVDRKRIRLSTPHAAEYHRNTKYNRPFWLRNDSGYIRKVK
jgi:hypothetical protein